MHLTNLKVKKLYRKYDYNVSFNSDITLIYGTNGCGKTTILNIITSIITGSIYNLFDYSFDEIILGYTEDNKKREKKIVLQYNYEENAILLTFNKVSEEIHIMQISEENKRKYTYDNMYFSKYPILKEVREEFNYVYLALNRAAMLPNPEDFFMKRRSFFYEDILEPENIDPEIKYIEKLISRRYLEVTTYVNIINNEFRNAILKSSLNVNAQADLESFIKKSSLDKKAITDIQKTKKSYMKILRDLQIASEDEIKQYAVFFDDYSKKLLENGNDVNFKNLFNLFLSFNEMKKIENIVEIAEEAEKKKAEYMKPIEQFLDIVNEFISSTDSNKKITINNSGRVVLKTSDQERGMSIQYLSSGERQILVFFANLIFSVKDTSSGIFVVDEPELSLHLSWQKVFVKKALEINKNVQFIFATHSPEIIGKYRDKTENLIKIEV